MSTAKQPGGLYYTTQGKAVDAEGRDVKGAPKISDDTPPDQQPGGANTPTPEERAAIALAKALQNPQAVLQQAEARNEARRQAAGQGKSAEHKPAAVDPDELPTLEELPAHLQTLTTAKEVQAYRKVDKRVGAKAIYQDRLAELEASDDDEENE